MRRFHSPALADRLAATPDYLAEPVQQDAAVLFIDLSGFTSVSERLGPEQTRELLKSLHTVIEDEVTRHGGLVLSYMGDGAMIVFGLPDPRPDDPDRAVSAALALIGHVRTWMDALPDALHEGLGVRVGAHFGPVVVSRLGADTHQHITATGDSVNVASRLLEVASAHHAGVAFSTDLLQALRAPVQVALSEEREISIRGRSRPLTVRFWNAPV
jgi:adenylate cyclase